MSHDPDFLDTVHDARTLVEAAEKIGQESIRRQARHSKGRTIELLPRLEGAALAEFTAQGFELDLSEQGANDLLAPMYLPDGWQRVPTDHDLYSHLVDEQGRNRVLIMVKTVAYDRDAWMRFL